MNICSLRFSYSLFNHQKAVVCETLADGTLFYCSPLFGIIIIPSVKKLLHYLALFPITDMYM